MSVIISPTIKLQPLIGGIYPPENKALSNHAPIQTPPLADEYIVPLLQSIGSPAEACVKVGQRVLKGQLIAQPSSPLSAALHAPTSGAVKAIVERPYPHTSGQDYPAIVIQADGLDQWTELAPLSDYQQLEPQQLIEKIRWAGISGLGGAGFPTAVKIATDKPIHTLILNGAECEPYITADDRLMRERAQPLIEGIEILAHIIQPQRILVAIEDNKPEALAAVKQAAQASALPIQVISFPTKYPSGGEKQLIQILLGSEVPSGKLPADLGVLCQNVGTAVAIADAVLRGKPLISRITTLTGDALYSPTNVEALIGTPISHLLKFAGLNAQRLNRLIIGGPMMGFTLQNPQAPIVKTINCVLAATAQELPPPPPAMPCIRCGDCAEVCPASLLPQQLHFYALGEDHQQLQAHHLFDCIECGACAYVCPSSIPLVQYYRAAKADIRDAERKLQKAEHARIRFEQRQERLRLDEERKEAERQARAERAAQARAAAAETPATPSPAEAQQADNAEQLKRLKIEASMARVALNKAQKQLADHGTEALQQQVKQLEQVAAAAQAAYQQAEQAAAATPATSTSSTANIANEEAIKKAKISLAMANANLRKGERNQVDAEQLAALQQAVNQAQQALDALTAQAASSTSSGSNTSTTQDAASKKIKIEIAMAKANLRKAERAEADGDQLAELQQLLSAAESELAGLAESVTPAAQPAVKSATDDAVKQAKIKVALAKANLRKAERAETDGDQLAELQQLLSTAESELAGLAVPQPAATKPTAPASNPAADPIKQAKIKLAMAKANLRKAERNQVDASTLAELQAELTHAEQQLAQLENG